MTDEIPLRRWLTGLPAGDLAAPAGRRSDPCQVVVVEAPGVLSSLVASGAIRNGAAVYVRTGAVSAAVAVQQATVRRYSGSFVNLCDDITVVDGNPLRCRTYGTAEFERFDTMTALQVRSSNDFSAFLRDADIAWETGTFLDHVTHPNATIADLASLGGDWSESGPRHRLFVGSSGSVSNSAYGLPLGTAASPMRDLDTTWRSVNAGSATPDAVGIGAAVPEQDRVEALCERPWMPRYVTVVEAVRTVRSAGLVPVAVSGFGQHAALPMGGAPPDAPAPVVVRLADAGVVIDVRSGRRRSLRVDDASAIEALLGTGRGSPNLSTALGMAADAVTRVLELLSSEDVAAGWCQWQLVRRTGQLGSAVTEVKQ